MAAKNGTSGLILALLEVGADLDVLSGKGFAPLHYAIGAIPLFNIIPLLKAGVDPNVKYPDGGTSLHAAAMRGIPAMIVALLEAGAIIQIDPLV